jgi:anthranilate synthase component 1
VSSPQVITTRTAFREAARDVPNGTRIPVEIRVIVDDPFEAYRRARQGDGRWDFYLETTGGQPGWGYFGIDPIDRIETDSEDGPTLSALADRLRDERLSRGECDVPYPCGVVGWLSYDVARELEDIPVSAADDRGLPRLQAGVYDRVAAWEHADSDGRTTLRVTACPRIHESAEAGDADSASGTGAVEPAYERGRRRALDLAERILDGDPDIEEPPAAARTAGFESDCGRAAFADRVRRVREYIRDGETFQANISHRLVAPAVAHPVEVFRALRRVNPAPYSALLEFPGVDLVSASPELLLHRDNDRLVTEPIAGTRPRGGTAEEDIAYECDLREDEKERAEHAMLVDLERNDLGKVSAYGSVDVTDYRRVDRYAEVMHLVSEIEGRLRDGTDLADAIAAVFPGGTITGAPKPRTMEIIEELETTRRGPYTGSIGMFGFDDRATLNIIIRTLVRYDEEYHLRVGAGIVHDSDPTQEYRETLDKARALVGAVDEALGQRANLSVRKGGSEHDTTGDSERTHEPNREEWEPTPR